MKAYASLWSADLLALGGAVIYALVDGYHLDVMDGGVRPRPFIWAGFCRCFAPADEEDTRMST